MSAPRTLEELPTPALLLELDALERNLTRMQALAARFAVALRPHVKTHKCLPLARRQLALGATGLTVSTLAEAYTFARAGFGDLTWALPNPLAHLPELLALARRVELGVLVDDLDAARALAAQRAPLKVWLKVDSGYHRAGVDPRSPEALALLRFLAEHDTLRFAGLLSHSGHAYAARSKRERAQVAEEERTGVLHLAERGRALGLPVPEISVGSTPALTAAEELSGVSEIRPGNYVFYDYTQASLGSCALADCALSVLASVISHQPGARRFVTDAGALALSKDHGPEHLPGKHGMGRIFRDLSARSLEPELCLTSLSQEHGLVEVEQADRLRGRFPVGSKLRILEHHSCLTAALFDAYWVVRGQEVVDRWPIERGRDLDRLLLAGA